jgi:hypothetical protein
MGSVAVMIPVEPAARASRLWKAFEIDGVFASHWL